MKSKKKKGSASNVTAAVCASKKINARKEMASEEIKTGIKKIKEVRRQFRNNTEEQVTGWIAEEVHAATINADARIKGINNKTFKSGKSAGKATGVGDIYLEDVPVAELKFHKTPARNATQCSQVKYKGQQRVVPKDHVKEAKRICKRVAKQNSTRNPAKADLRNETAENITDRIKVKVDGKNLESKPLTLEEAKKITRDPKRLEKLTPKPSLKDEFMGGLVSGATMAGGISALGNTVKALKGEKSVGEAAKDSLIDAATGGGRAVATVAGKVAIQKGLTSIGAKSLAKGSLPAVAASTCIETLIDTVDYCKGEIDGPELAKRSAKNVGSAASGWAGAEVGALVGSAIFPGVGTAVGAIAGGILGTLGFNSLWG